MCKLCVCPSVCLLVFLSFGLSVCLLVFLSFGLSVFMLNSLSVQNLTCVTFLTTAQCPGIAMGGSMFEFTHDSRGVWEGGGGCLAYTPHLKKFLAYTP
jgi:hypothetical protein